MKFKDKMESKNKIKVKNNDHGIISTGSKSTNKILIINERDLHSERINWNRVSEEIELLKSDSDLSMEKFASEAEEYVKKKNTKGFLTVLRKWLPCIGKLIESSYYLIEIAKNFNIKIG